MIFLKIKKCIYIYRFRNSLKTYYCIWIPIWFWSEKLREVSWKKRVLNGYSSLWNFISVVFWLFFLIVFFKILLSFFYLVVSTISSLFRFLASPFLHPNMFAALKLRKLSGFRTKSTFIYILYSNGCSVELWCRDEVNWCVVSRNRIIVF